ncbi:hypothetical protein [Mycoplasma sp. E35C]|uniref:hypothetical protein n=1 Tax=Mycoplasma sp. E35C TaxID=2801918 RepID=UPI001CA3FBE3|nr:hypothetical protein [Mycoplasma sp. E35C]QZX48896.1 hypothetical protein JJE79_02450 [Mycoplasma sp. E35C]
MQNNNKKYTIDDALINSTADFINELDDDFESDDLIQTTNQTLVTAKIDEEELSKTPSELITADKTTSTPVKDHLDINNIDDLYSNNTGTFNTLSVHDVSYIERQTPTIIKPIHNQPANNINQKSNNTTPKSYGVFGKMLDKQDFDKPTNKIHFDEPTNQQTDDQDVISTLDQFEINQTPPVDRSKTLFKKEHEIREEIYLAKKKNIDDSIFERNKVHNGFEASSLFEEVTNDPLDIKPKYRDDEFQHTTSVTTNDLFSDDQDEEENKITQPSEEILINQTGKVDYELEEEKQNQDTTDEDIVAKKQTVDIENIENNIDQIVEGEKKNFYQYIKKNDHDNVSTTMLLNTNKDEALHQPINEQPNPDVIRTNAQKTLTNSNYNSATIQKTLTNSNAIKSEEFQITRHEPIHNYNQQKPKKNNYKLAFIIAVVIVILLAIVLGVVLSLTNIQKPN